MKRQKNRGNRIRNIPAFVTAYLGSKSGQAALTKTPFRARNKDTGEFENVWRNPIIAQAFQQAIDKRRSA